MRGKEALDLAAVVYVFITYGLAAAGVELSPKVNLVVVYPLALVSVIWLAWRQTEGWK